MSFPCTTVPRPGSVELCAPQNCCTTAAAVILASSIAAQRSASTDLGFADPRYAVKRNDHSGQSLCSPVNVGALPMVLVSTRGAATLGTAATCCRVSIRAFSVCTRPALPHPISSEHQSSLRLKCCFIISTLRYHVWEIYLFVHVREVCTLLQYQVTRFHSNPPQLVPTPQPVTSIVGCCQV